MILKTPLAIAAAVLMATGLGAAMSTAEAAPGHGARHHHRHAGPPPGHQSRKFHGGEGSSWKTGRNSYGFQGRYGGCQYVGGAGPGGYRINRICR